LWCDADHEGDFSGDGVADALVAIQVFRYATELPCLRLTMAAGPTEAGGPKSAGVPSLLPTLSGVY
jgi:hypothetical protein